MKNPFELIAELEKSKEWNRLARLKHFGVSLFVFRQNSEELRKLVEWAKLHRTTFNCGMSRTESC